MKKKYLDYDDVISWSEIFFFIVSKFFPKSHLNLSEGRLKLPAFDVTMAMGDTIISWLCLIRI